jgi:nucleotide-binding universal stress UspA family protein
MPESAGRWSHPSVILVATDLSDLDRVIPFAIKEATETESRLLLLHVLNASAAIAVDAVGLPYYDPASAADYAAKTLEAWRGIAHQKGIACDILVREGNAAQQIAAAARQFNAGRLLLGTRSRGKVSKLLLGSVAEQVLRSVNLPVMTVGPEAHLTVQGSSTPRVVLHATTLRETSRPSAALACQIAITQRARLVLLHVMQTSADGKNAAADLEAVAKAELASIAEATGSNEMGCPACVEPRVVHGNPAIEILAMASELDASLIVLGATQRSALQNLTRDRTIYRVLAHAQCPVLTLREAATAVPQSPETASLLHF